MDRARDTRSAAQWIGRSLTRREDDALLRGEGRFVGDIAPADCLHLHFLRSPHASARIVKVDVSRAERAPGVVRILTGTTTGPLRDPSINMLFPVSALDQPSALPIKCVDWVGQPVAAIVAETEFAAADAASLIEVQFEPQQEDEAEPIFEKNWVSSGNIEPADDARTCVATVTVAHPRLAPAPMEPRVTLVECDDTGHVTAWIGTQTPQRARSDLATVLSIDESRIRVIAPDVGGAFGGKASIYPEDIIVAAASIELRRAVKWVGTRSEEFLAATHGRGGQSNGELIADADGRFLSLRARFDMPLGARLPYSAMVPARNAGRILPGPYGIGAIDVSVRGRREHRAPVGIYRGAGRPEAAMLLERLVDEVARILKVDPLDLRLKNVVPADRLPRRSAAGEPIDANDFRQLLVIARDAAQYSQMRSEQTKRRQKGAFVGIGCALYVEPCGYGGESASIEVFGDRIVATTGSSTQGQGRETAFAQIVADVLYIEPSRVTVVHGDTRNVPTGVGALASRSTPIGGSALYVAAEELRELARSRAARLMSCTVDQVTLGAAGFENLATGEIIQWRQLSGLGAPPLRSAVEYKPDGEAWSSGCCVAAVEVDGETGKLEIEKIVWVDDAGALVNPLLVHGQLWGGLMQGLGEAVKEQLVYDDAGQLLTASFMDYAAPRATDVPDVTFEHLETPSVFNALGAKGVGEAGCIGIPAAIVNAVIDALAPSGVRHIDMPLTTEKIWSALRSAAWTNETDRRSKP